MKNVERFILITNLEFVVINDVRMHVNALLLEDSPDDVPAICRMRGFGPDPAWEVFDLRLPSIAYTLEDAQSTARLNDRPLTTGAIMRVVDGPEIQLHKAKADEALNIEALRGRLGEQTILHVWELLTQRTRRYWRHPAMPRLHYVRP